MPAAAPLSITPADLAELRRWARSSHLPAVLAQRARILLLAAAGASNTEIAQRVGVSRPTVIACRRRYVRRGLEGLPDRPRPGRPQTVRRVRRPRSFSAPLSPPPARLGITHWSTRLLGRELGVSRDTIARIWREYGVQPWRAETFKFSTDPQLAAKVQDVVGLYLHPPERAVVLCVDEKSQIQALERTQPVRRVWVGRPEQRTHDYVRHGTTTLFAALEVATGRITNQCALRHRHQEFLAFLKQVASACTERYTSMLEPQLDPGTAERTSRRTPTQNGDMNPNQGGKRSAASRQVDGLVVAGLVRERGAARLAWALTALSTVLLVLAVVLLLLNRDLGFNALSPHLFLVPGFAVVGLVLAVRRPGNAIGWLFVGMGLVAAVQAFAVEYAIRSLATAPGSLPAAAWMAWLATWTFLLNLPALALLLLWFPDGRVPSPRWRVVPWLLGSAIAGVTVWVMLRPDPIDLGEVMGDVRIANPAAVAALDDPAIQAIGVVPNILTFLTLFVGSVACALAPFVRRRRAQAIERQQLKWLAAVAGGSGLVGAAGFLMAGFASSTATVVGGLLLVVALVGVAVGIPVAVGLAILRYRLYDIDRIINRTLVYGLLTAVLGLGYAGVVLVLGQVFGGVGGNPPSWAVAGATLAMAALFQPLRRRIQQAVDRRFNRRRYDTTRTIEAFSARLRDQVDLDTLTGELLAVVDLTMQPTQVSVWLRPAPPGSAGAPRSEAQPTPWAY